MSVLLLAVLAVALAWPVPMLLHRARWVRRAPGTAMMLWQAVALAGGLSLIGTPLAWGRRLRRHLGESSPGSRPPGRRILVVRLEDDAWLPARIAAVTGAVLLAGHLVLTLAVTAFRPSHSVAGTAEVELLAAPPGDAADPEHTRVLPHDVPWRIACPG